MFLSTDQLRKLFLEYFQKKEHTVVPGSSLIPGNDPTLLFTNAGMVQFKDTFLGVEKRAYVRAVSCQPCVRAGGKHNDLENVGYTARHHTFFEMLGNFSFGDYFKREAIQYAWEFLTEVLKIPKERLWVTVFKDDHEAEEIWLQDMKIDPKRFSRCGEKDNFWSMGETGPCGPCTEIYYDHGETIPGGPPGSPEEEGDRFVEIWNLVFMQYNRSEDGSLSALPKPSVDTGMGLERIAAVMQGVHSNYDIDIFQKLIQAVIQVTHSQDTQSKSLRVIADHIRSCVFLITDGVTPSNEGRGYVLRRICRRAIRHGVLLGSKEPFFYKLAKPLTNLMKEAYPKLQKSLEQVERVLQQEEVQFAKTLEQGLKILAQDLESVKDKVIPGETVFKLYDTYGFPVDLTADIARERHLTIDYDGFNEAMAKQKTRARQASQFVAEYSESLDLEHSTDFTGYEQLEHKAVVVGLLYEGKAATVLKAGMEGAVILATSPFYAEAGGQVGDQGTLSFSFGEFQVKNTKKIGQTHVHYGILSRGELTLDDQVVAKVDFQQRRSTALNHSATHLLHAALRKVLGPHVQQKGSLVEPQRLRFDYTHAEPLTHAQIVQVERLVNEQIRLNTEVITDIMPMEKALESGAMALFGEKYGEDVRVLHMGGDFSVELCGGTHVKRLGDIGLFKIMSQSGISSGVRRVIAVTGEIALEMIENLENNLETMATLLKCNREVVSEKLQGLVLKNRQLEKELSQVKKNMLNKRPDEIEDKIQRIEGVSILAAELPLDDIKTLREIADQYKSKLKTAAIVLAGIHEDKILLIAAVTKDMTDKIHAGELLKYVAQQVGGQGGGRADMAQGGGSDLSKISSALNSVYGWVEEKLKKTG